MSEAKPYARLWRRRQAVVGHYHANFVSLVGTDVEPRFAVLARRYADQIDQRRRQAVEAEREFAPLELLIDDADGVAIAHRTVRQPHEHRIAVVDHADALAFARRQRIQHQAAGPRADSAERHGAHPYQPEERLLAFHPELDVDVGVIGNEAGRAAELLHHRVASVDAQAALDAAEAGAFADVNAGRADAQALLTVGAVAGRLAHRAQLFRLRNRTARLAAVVAVSDVERVFVG